MKLTLAVYKNIRFNYTQIEETRCAEGNEAVVQMTQSVDVEFPELSAEVTVPQEIAFHEKAKATVQTAAALEVKKIDETISKLRAITHQP